MEEKEAKRIEKQLAFEAANAMHIVSGKTYTLCIEKDVEDEYVFAVVRKPSRQTIAYVTILERSDPVEAKHTLFADCIVAGDKDLILNDDEYFFAACEQLDVLLRVKASYIKKN